jgi:hypothetical protein
MLADMAAGIEASRLLYLKSAYEIDQAQHSAACGLLRAAEGG